MYWVMFWQDTRSCRRGGSPRCVGPRGVTYLRSFLSVVRTLLAFAPAPWLTYLCILISPMSFTPARCYAGEDWNSGGHGGGGIHRDFPCRTRHPWFPPRPDPAPHAPHVAPKTALAPAVARPGRRAPCFRPWSTHATLPRESIHGQPQKVLEVVCRSGSCMRVVRTPCWMASARAWSGSG